MGPDAAEDAKDRLHKQRWLDEPLLEEERQVIEVADVVALELKAGPACAEVRDDRLDVLEGVLKDEVARHLQVLVLPLVPEALDPVEHGKEAEVHAAHVQRAKFGLEMTGGSCTLLERHPMAAAGRDVDDHVAARAYLGQEPSEHLRIRRRPAVLRVARVQVHYCRPGLGGADGVLRDLARRDW